MAVVTGSYGDTTLQEVFQQLRRGVEVKDRKWLGQTYKACADATEMVDWLEKQAYCRTRPKAVEICTELQKQDAIVHVWGSKKLVFKDMQMFFRFAGGGEEPELADAYDLVVIGAGTAGISATSLAGSFGANVVMIEANRVGGDCTWSGCVPSKSLIKAANDVYAAREASQRFGVGLSQPSADMKKVKDYVWERIHQIDKLDMHMLSEHCVPIRYGHASFLDGHTLQLKSREGELQKIKARSFILCLGAVPAAPPIKGLDSVKYHTYETIFDVEVLPRQMVVVGGGVIGCEMAQSFARLGASVTIVASRLLPKEPKKVDELLSQTFEEEGIKIVRGRGSSVEKVDNSGERLRLAVSVKDQPDVILQCDLLLVATGRRPNTSGMNLEAAGVQVDPKSKLITVSKSLQTTAPHIYAAGDCCTLQQFTHYASIMGVWAGRNLLLPGSMTPTHIIPRATFTHPEVASVGLTEDEARAAGHEVFSLPAEHNERAVCEADRRGFIDVYLDKGDRVVGACIMNNRAGEMLTEILVAMNKDMQFPDLALGKVLHPYPTYTWATSMLATEVKKKRIHESVKGKAVRWYVGRGASCG